MKRSISTVVVAATCAAACAAPAVARTPHTSATQTCSKVSASSVSSIIGYNVPAASGESLYEKGTKLNDGISATTLDCSYGKDTSLAAIKKTVSISTEQLSRAPSAGEVKTLVERTATLVKGAHLTLKAYSGLGGPAYVLMFSEAGISVESLILDNGNKLYGATVYGSIGTSKLASLVKLAEKL